MYTFTHHNFIPYTGSAVALRGAYFGQGAGPVLLSGLKCSGSEPSLLACLRGNSVVGSTSCSHSQDAAVICSGKFRNIHCSMLSSTTFDTIHYII